MLGRSLLAYIPVNLVTMLLSFGNIIILTRILSGQEYGRYAIAIISIQFFHMLFLTWTEAAMARYYARAEQDNEIPTLLKTIYVYTLMVGLLAALILIAGLWFIPMDASLKLLLSVALGSTCIKVLTNLSFEYNKASHNIGRFSFLFCLDGLVTFLLGVYLILEYDSGALGPLIGITIGVFVIMLIDLPRMLKNMKGGKVDHNAAKKYFNYGFPICLSLVLSYALSSADVYLIAGLMNETAAGQYSAGYNLAARTLDIIFVWIGMAVTPIAVTTIEQIGLEESRKVMKNYAVALLAIALPAATGLALIAEPAGFILGESVREEAVKIMPLIALSSVLCGLNAFYAQRAYMLSGKTVDFVWALALSLIHI